MPLYLLLFIMGGCFVVLGIIFYFWGRYEEERYYNTIVHRFDVREFIEHLPFRPEPGALRIGGIIMLILGVMLLAAGGILWGLNIPVKQ
jgi:predicted membrane channel-forming protein YqfA (hemolysin III family)